MHLRQVMTWKVRLILAAVTLLFLCVCEGSNYHLNGPCQLWWPLNNTDVHVFPIGADMLKFQTSTEVIISCPTLHQHENDLPFESLVNMQLGEDGQVQPQRSGIVVRVEDADYVQNNQAPLVYKISPKWNPRVPLILPYEIMYYKKSTKRSKSLRVSVYYSDGTSISNFSELVLQLINIVEPRWALHDLPNFSPESYDDNSDEQDLISVETDTSSQFEHSVPAFINSIKNRDELGHWLSLLLPADLTSDNTLAIAEIGVQRAEYSLGTLLHGCGSLCRNWVLVDVWDLQNLSAGDYIDAANAHDHKREELASNYEIVQDKAKQLVNSGDYTVTIMRNTSVGAARELRRTHEALFWQNINTYSSIEKTKHSIDLVYLDARHDYRSVVDDICAWFPLVTPGGLLAGHDYIRSRLLHDTLFTVRQAVDKFAFDMGLELRSTCEEEYEFPTWFIFRPRKLSELQRKSFRRFCAPV